MPGSKEIGGKLSDFGEGFTCGNIKVRRKRSCRYGLCIVKRGQIMRNDTDVSCRIESISV